MPTYQYSCTECGEPLEVVQSFSDDALTECPACGGKLRKLYNAVGIVFKGSGFYRTDSRSGSSATEPATVKSDSAKSDSGSAGSSDSGSSGAAPAATTTPATSSSSPGSTKSTSAA